MSASHQSQPASQTASSVGGLGGGGRGIARDLYGLGSLTSQPDTAVQCSKQMASQRVIASWPASPASQPHIRRGKRQTSSICGGKWAAHNACRAAQTTNNNNKKHKITCGKCGCNRTLASRQHTWFLQRAPDSLVRCKGGLGLSNERVAFAHSAGPFHDEGFCQCRPAKGTYGRERQRERERERERDR